MQTFDINYKHTYYKFILIQVVITNFRNKNENLKIPYAIGTFIYFQWRKTKNSLK